MLVLSGVGGKGVMSKEAGAGAPKIAGSTIEVTKEALKVAEIEVMDYDPDWVSSEEVVRRVIKALLGAELVVSEQRLPGPLE